ncbi:histone deacetylase 8 [Flagelloscypha sp. PMI_526]|nr:histone deacetylase 8 [Flagelloscypha sp. PMI_526]
MNVDIPARIPPTVAYVVSQDLIKYSSLLPSNPKRSLAVHALIRHLGLLERQSLQVLKPSLAGRTALELYHDPEYLDFVLDDARNSSSSEASNHVTQEAIEEFGLRDDSPPFPGLPNYVRLVAGASITAAGALKSGKFQTAIAWDGGRHHSQKARASGYCYVADCVLAILLLKHVQPSAEPTVRRPRIMYLDLDLHFSDGVSQAFHSKSIFSQVLSLSIHHASPGFFPPVPLANLPSPSSSNFSPFSLSIPLKEGASNATFLRIWNIVQQVKDVFWPDFVVLQCGVDGLAGDPCATWNWSLGPAEGETSDEGSLGWFVKQVQNWGKPLLVLGGGGYNTPNAARAHAYLTSVLTDNPLPLSTPLEHHSMFGPSFTLDVPPSFRQDENMKNGGKYLSEVEERFNEIVTILRERVARAGK